MGHIQNFERELRERVRNELPEDIVKWLKDEMLRSYRNGLAAKPKSKLANAGRREDYRVSRGAKGPERRDAPFD